MGTFSAVFAVLLDLSYTLLVTGCFTLYVLGIALYRLYFHPLSKYPGPFLWKISRLPHAWYCCTGRIAYKITDFHGIYGPIVRIAPDELNFILEDAWQDIYGKPLPRNSQLRKDPDQFVANPDGPLGLLLEPSDEIHARHRRNLAPGFSEKILRVQEPLLNKYFGLLIQRLRENSGSPVDVAQYYEFATFDIVGDLTYGESFDCLEKLEVHLCLKLLHTAGKAIAILGIMQKFHPLDKIFLAIFARIARKDETMFRTLTREKLLKRLELPDPRPDFIAYVQRHLNSAEGMTFGEISETCGVLLAAGSETTASLLTAVTFYLTTHPSILKNLTTEIRNAFRSESEITIVSVNRLEYLLAVLNEALRIHPPVGGNLVRITPREGCMIAGRFIPGDTHVAINHWSASHSPLNFTRPYEFIPERWMGSLEFREDKRRVFNPFNVGPRNCIGRNLAYVEMRVILARMVYNFDMELCEQSKGWKDRQVMYLLWENWRPLMLKLSPVAR
ncbi:uncharacterized protein L3040_003098 [Drepanopeziza brunnea f. sp. 'multigermtubi']|uniref:uncharacterized protein n=1 Tax=Drepanopeziza brunnea f. sp. 'multigermtubi' TaxID=698441 RepID=UPI00239148D5|nr:hypothetical protein L3040_003098 [Drepanopeziza brunnea f. sp. 'multigermtubi']